MNKKPNSIFTGVKKPNINTLGIKYYNTRKDMDFNNLYELLYPYLLKTMRRVYSTEKAIVDDSIQMTLIKVVKYIHTYKPMYAFTTWVSRILRNEFLLVKKTFAKKNEISLDEITGF